MEPSPVNLCQPLTLQETERNIIQAGEEILMQSQGEDGTSNAEHTMEEKSLHSRITLPEGTDGLLSSF